MSTPQPPASLTPTPTDSPAPTPAPTHIASPTPTSAPAHSVDDLLARMTLEQKVGQVMIIGLPGPGLTAELRREIVELHPGGYVLYDRNVESPRQVAQLNTDLQQAARSNGDPPLLITLDQEGGVVARLKQDKGFTEFPGAMAIAATGDVENARRAARAISVELRAVGFNMDLAPDLDVNNNPQNPVISTRSFGSDPARVAEFGAAFIETMQAEGIAAVGKHLPGHGDTAVDSHVSLPTVPHDRARLESVEFVPFKAAIKSRVAGIMSAHVTFPAIDPTPALPATLSRHVLTGLVRDEFQYDGVLMTDELGMGALGTAGYPPPKAAAAALAAGADVLLFQTGVEMHRQVQQELIARIKRGEIPMARLDQAVRRVLLLKQRFGILTSDPAVGLDPDGVGTATSKTLAREIAAHSITLLRDEAHLLPIDPKTNVLVVETSALGLGQRLGATTVQVPADPKPSDITAAAQAARDRRVVVVATSDVAKNRKQIDLVDALAQTRAPLIVIATRSPYDVLYLQNPPTYIATYGAPPPTLDALVDVLRGRIKAEGRLPVELPGIQ